MLKKIPALYREHWGIPQNDYQITDSQRIEALDRVGQDIHWLLSFLETKRKSFLRLPELEVLQTLPAFHYTGFSPRFPVCMPERESRLRLNLHYPILRKRRAESKTQSFRELMKRRPPVEGNISKYREIRSQFFHALVEGSTSDIDPYCPDDNFWRGTLFRSSDYYLLVGGYPNGSSLPGPREIKIDYLPQEITTGYEIDAYNLEKWPAAIERDGSDIFITVKSGFSAVLLPKPSCPPKVEAEVSEDKIFLSMFAPWREDLDIKEFRACIEMPGFEITGSAMVTLPAVVEYEKTKATSKPGNYYFIIRGDQVLPYRGWFVVE